jgi:hypothetical protein
LRRRWTQKWKDEEEIRLKVQMNEWFSVPWEHESEYKEQNAPTLKEKREKLSSSAACVCENAYDIKVMKKNCRPS